jgi:hypothetical protein
VRARVEVILCASDAWPQEELTYNVAHWSWPPNEAASWTDVEDDTDFVLAVKVALCAPVGTVTLDGTLTTAWLLLKSPTTAPPAGAGALNITVPVDVPPPRTHAGENESEKGIELAGWIVMVPGSLPCLPWPSVTVTVKLKVPAVVGSPLMLAGGDGQSRLMPAGSCPALIEYVYGATPPERKNPWV